MVNNFTVLWNTEKSKLLLIPLPTITCNYNVYIEAITIMSGSVLRTCCEFRIISPIVKQLQTSGKKQWSTLGFAQLCCSFEACHYSRTCEINWKLSHRKSRLSICSDTYNLAVQFISGLKSASKLELLLALRCFLLHLHSLHSSQDRL